MDHCNKARFTGVLESQSFYQGLVYRSLNQGQVYGSLRESIHLPRTRLQESLPRTSLQESQKASEGGKETLSKQLDSVEF